MKGEDSVKVGERIRYISCDSRSQRPPLANIGDKGRIISIDSRNYPFIYIVKWENPLIVGCNASLVSEREIKIVS